MNEAAYLRKLCSDVTLQSQKEGFFNSWAEKVESDIPRGFLEEFGHLTTDLDRIKAVWKLEAVHGLQIQSFAVPKNPKVAGEKRQAGNEAFQSRDDARALQLYSQAVIRAPPHEEDLSLSLANRSAVLFHLEEYELCLQDISLALGTNYPQRLHYKVQDRRGACLAKLGRMRDAQGALEDALKALRFSTLDDAKKQCLANDLKARIEISKRATTEPPTKDHNHDLHEDLFNGSSSSLPNASKAMCLKYSEENGRYMAASKDIPVGKVLVREAPFCAILMPEKRGRFCEQCFKYLLAPIPCSVCSGVTFCSPRCRDVAWNSYHKWECSYLNLFIGSGMALNCFLALRIITSRGLNYFKENFPRALVPHSDLSSMKKVYSSEDYANFYNLVGLEGQRTVPEFLKRTLMAIFLLKVLQHASFFSSSKKQGKALTEDEALIGALLLRHLQVIQFNAHEVSGISFEGELKFKKCRSVFLGLAVYPTVSFFNHSCFPAIGRYFVGTEMTIVNLRPLRKGEMVPENYGPIFTHSSKGDRQKKLLSRYWFTCKCEACIEDWPIYANMTNTIQLKPDPIFSLDNHLETSPPNKKDEKKKKRGKKHERKFVIDESAGANQVRETECPDSCDQVPPKLTLEEAHKDFERGKALMDDFQRENAMAAFGRWTEAALRRIQLPMKDVHLSLEAMRLLVAARGNYYIVDKQERKSHS